MGVTNLSGLSITPADPRGGTAFEVTAGTVALVCDPIITGAPAITGDGSWTGSPTITGDPTITGTLAVDEIRVGDINVSSAANVICGKRAVTSGSTFCVLTNSSIAATSRIFLTPAAGDTYPFCGIRAVGAGTASFFMTDHDSGTGGTTAGDIHYLIINL